MNGVSSGDSKKAVMTKVCRQLVWLVLNPTIDVTVTVNSIVRKSWYMLGFMAKR